MTTEVTLGGLYDAPILTEMICCLGHPPHKGGGVDLLLVKKGFSAIKIFEFMLDNFIYNGFLFFELKKFDMIKLEFNNIAVCICKLENTAKTQI